jgi:hypothetical protein
MKHIKKFESFNPGDALFLASTAGMVVFYFTLLDRMSGYRLSRPFLKMGKYIRNFVDKRSYKDDIEKLNKIVEDYFEKEAKMVTDKNEKEIDNLLQRSSLSKKDGGVSNKFYELRYQVFIMYWKDFIEKNRSNLTTGETGNFKILNQDELYNLLISGIYYKLGIDKDLKSESMEVVAKDLEKFTKYVKDRNFK